MGTDADFHEIIEMSQKSSPESLTSASNPRTYFVVNTADEAERSKAEAARLRWDTELAAFYTRSRRIKARALDAGFRVLQ